MTASPSTYNFRPDSKPATPANYRKALEVLYSFSGDSLIARTREPEKMPPVLCGSAALVAMGVRSEQLSFEIDAFVWTEAKVNKFVSDIRSHVEVPKDSIIESATFATYEGKFRGTKYVIKFRSGMILNIFQQILTNGMKFDNDFFINSEIVKFFGLDVVVPSKADFIEHLLAKNDSRSQEKASYLRDLDQTQNVFKWDLRTDEGTLIETYTTLTRERAIEIAIEKKVVTRDTYTETLWDNTGTEVFMVRKIIEE